jgi:hypothetical protein
MLLSIGAPTHRCCKAAALELIVEQATPERRALKSDTSLCEGRTVKDDLLAVLDGSPIRRRTFENVAGNLKTATIGADEDVSTRPSTSDLQLG